MVPHVGIKEGVLFDLVDSLVRTAITRTARRARSWRAPPRRPQVPLRRGPRPARGRAGASLLFDQLRPLHGLEDRDRKILQAAALLHDIGQFVSYKGHHKHSLYLISQYRAAQLRRTRDAAGGQRRALPPQGPPAGSPSLLHDPRRRANRIGSPAGGHPPGRPTRSTANTGSGSPGVTAKVSDDEVALWLDGTAGLLLEGWTLKKKASLFNKVFGRKVMLRFLGAGTNWWECSEGEDPGRCGWCGDRPALRRLPRQGVGRAGCMTTAPCSSS